MAELNEEQLLLLNSLMYYKGSAQQGLTVKQIALMAIDTANNYDPSSCAFSGGFDTDPESMIDIANAILADDSLRNLTVVDSINTDGVRASNFVDFSTGESTIAVRGTGGSYEAWSDNFDGLNDMHTDCQEDFYDFFCEQAENYDNITLTGHSKGGNMAQYATVLGGDKVDRCVSFDGQGFNDEFCETYADQIAANADKIKSISGDEDYVNILLNDIAGEKVYLNTTDGENAHSSYALWKENQNTINGNGEYSNTVEQSDTMKFLDKFVDSIADIVNGCPDYVENAFVDFLGSVVGIFFAISSGQLKLEDAIEAIWDLAKFLVNGSIFFTLGKGKIELLWELIKELVDEITDLFKNDDKKENTKKKEKTICVGPNVNGNYLIDVNLTNLSKFEKELSKCKSKLISLSVELWALNLANDYPDDLDKTLKKIKNKIDDQKDAVSNLDKSLDKIIKLYKTTETNISSTSF